MIQIEAVKAYSDVLALSVNRLLPQLFPAVILPTEAELRELIENPNTILFTATDDFGQICGMLTLVFFRIPTGLHSRIEDVVVDASVRGQGVGELLVQEAIGSARANGARSVDLTSRPTREAANRLYRRCGFVQRETNVYRIEL